MPTQSEILDAMQFDLSPVDVLNTTGAPAYVIDYQFAGNSQPGDLWQSYSGWTALTSAEKAAIRDAMDHIETLINVTFVEVTGSPDPTMNIGKANIPGSTIGYGGFNYSYWSGGALADYDNFTVFDTSINLADASAQSLILHEIGHALALKHPFDGSNTLPAAFDTNKYTLMSYTPNPETGQDADAMMLYDIFALQDWWGQNTSHNPGDTSYTGPRTSTIDPLWDTGGDDTIDASARGSSVEIDLREGYFSRFGTHDDMVIPFGVTIENAIGGTGSDTINGNEADNLLSGLSGNDVLSGFGGDDLLLGGDGFDTLEGGAGDDTVNGGNGRDMVLMGTGNDLFIDNGQGGVNGQDTVHGNQGNDTIEGGNGDDVFYGGLGNDVIRGRKANDQLYGGDGYDTLDGGDGNDQIWGGNGRDRVLLGNGNDTFFDNGQAGVNGQDTVFGGNGFDTINGGAGNDVFYGGNGNDRLLGGNGDDRLYGGNNADVLFGGDGNDSLWGGGGIDQLTGGAGLDTFLFADGFGNDTIFGFEADDGEKISLAGVTAIENFADLLANHLNNVGGIAQIQDGANTILLDGIAFADVGIGMAYSGDDFLF